ncbi:MAG: alkaline phosphatase family protein [Planctomycetota bacterium]|nr:alkaline phosphatase family protein [Planctomycetota bacterium]
MTRTRPFPVRVAVVATCLAASAALAQTLVGPAAGGGTIVPTNQLVRPAGDTVEFAARPVDVAFSPDGSRVFAKHNGGVLVLDAATWKELQNISCGGASMVGLAVRASDAAVYTTTAKDELVELTRADDGTYKVARRIKLPGPGGKGSSFPCGIALGPSDAKAYVCLSVNNTLAEVDLTTGRVEREIPVGVAPYGVVLTPDASEAYVTCWGGRRPAEGQATAPSAGTPVAVDARGIASGGGVAVVSLAKGEMGTFIDTGRSPCAIAMSPDAGRVYVANANDDTLSVIDTKARTVAHTVNVKPDASLPFGSMPHGVALADDGATVLVALGGNNAVAVIDGASLGVRGFIPTGWFPGNLAVHERHLVVGNVKGVGSRTQQKNRNGLNSHNHRGSVQRVSLPDADALASMTDQVKADALVPQALLAQQRAANAAETPPAPVPARVGDPSPIQHCVYILKENRTYDQVFGAIGRGNSEPSLCIYGRTVTPNHHALADEFVLLDNYYCNGVLSADGHSWATEGNVTPYLERSFGGFTRSYTFGDDPLTYSSSGFLWDHVLAAGLSFRNYGEFDYANEKPDVGYDVFYKDWQEKTGKIRIEHNIGIANLRTYSHPDYPGWNMDIPDVYRAEIFLTELAEFEKKGMFPNLVFIYLPNDHTSGTGEGNPTPRSLVADNDLAMGRIVEGLSKSRFWPAMAIFINEDDPQDGFDHVDGHRSLCLVVSPYSRQQGKVISTFYNQSSVYHTIQRILGLAPANQLVAASNVMTDCFVPVADLAPYRVRENTVPLCEMNPKKATLSPRMREFAEISARLELGKPDACDEDTLNRILWHDAKGEHAPYPEALAGAHGTGLPALGLTFGGAEDEDEHEDQPGAADED